MTKTEKINEDVNKDKEERIKKVVAKDNCMDLFKNFSSAGCEKMSHEQFMSYKFQKKTRELILSQLRIMMNMKIISGEVYVNSMLKKIDLEKELLILDIALGMEVFLGAEFN